MMLVLAVITILATMATGSGNAAFYAFAELIPKLATQMGVNPAFLTIPMLQASNLGRGLSPVSGVVVAVSGMGKISPFEVVKRMSVPMLVGFICVIIGTEIFVSVEYQPFCFELSAVNFLAIFDFMHLMIFKGFHQIGDFFPFR